MKQKLALASAHDLSQEIEFDLESIPNSSNIPALSKKLQEIKSVHESMFQMIVKSSNKFNYDTVVIVLISFLIFSLGCSLVLCKIGFGTSVPFLGVWNSLLSFGFVWRALENTSEEVSRLVFSVLQTLTKNLKMLLILMASFIVFRVAISNIYSEKS